jgi:hypothetical protein
MKNKRFLVIGVTLILLALVAGVAFAANHYGELNGVTWLRVEGKSPLRPNGTGTHHIQLQNNNNYAVIVYTSIGQSGIMQAKQDSYHISCFSDTTITKVVKY